MTLWKRVGLALLIFAIDAAVFFIPITAAIVAVLIIGYPGRLVQLTRMLVDDGRKV